MRLIPLLALIGIGYLLINFFKTRPQPPADGRDTRRMDGGSMVRCAHCGLHVPQDEAVWQNGRPYCCREHGRLDS